MKMDKHIGFEKLMSTHFLVNARKKEKKKEGTKKQFMLSKKYSKRPMWWCDSSDIHTVHLILVSMINGQNQQTHAITYGTPIHQNPIACGALPGSELSSHLVYLL